MLSKTLTYFVVINEYGITDIERIQVGKDICLPLLEKILVDLMFWKEKTSEDNFWKYRNEAESDNWRHIRTRLYFTSASHMYSLLNILTLGNNRYLLQKSPPE
jgi:inositol hexakisphosphate/diphosphoinositol-pentakisphosphate kinase